MVTSFPQSFHYRSNKQNIYLHLNSANAPQCGLTVFSPFREIISNNCSIPLWWKLNTCSYLTTAWMPSLRPIFPYVNFCQMLIEFGPSAKVLVLSILGTGSQASCRMIGKYFSISTAGNWHYNTNHSCLQSTCSAWCCDGGCHCYFITAYFIKCQHIFPLQTLRQKWMIKLKPGK